MPFSWKKYPNENSFFSLWVGHSVCPHSQPISVKFPLSAHTKNIKGNMHCFPDFPSISYNLYLFMCPPLVSNAALEIYILFLYKETLFCHFKLIFQHFLWFDIASAICRFFGEPILLTRIPVLLTRRVRANSSYCHGWSVSAHHIDTESSVAIRPPSDYSS